MPMSLQRARLIVAEVKRRGLVSERVWSPHKRTPKQLEFSKLDNLEALYGGAAGGGKSDEILAGALENVNVPGFAALLLRRNFPQLTKANSLIPRAHEWLSKTDARWKELTHTYTFPSGSTIEFGHLQHEKDKYNYQSAEYQYIGFDELTQFTETQYTYLLSRLRRVAGSTLTLKARSATNPGGTGHEWVKRRFVEAITRKGRVFVPALLEDNPHLDQAEYEKSLEAMRDGDPIAYEQLRRGRWVRDSGGLIYKYNGDVNAAEDLPIRADWQFILGVDLGASESKPTTAFALIAFSMSLPDRVFVAESAKYAGMIPSTIAEMIEAYGIQIQEDGELESDGLYATVMDTGALGVGYKGEIEQRHQIPIVQAQKSDKLGYRKLMNGDFKRGHLRIVEHENAELIEEFNTLSWNDQGTAEEKGSDNHISDAVLYAWRMAKHWLAKEIPNMPKAGTLERAQFDAAQLKRRRAERIRDKGRAQPPGIKPPGWMRRG